MHSELVHLDHVETYYLGDITKSVNDWLAFHRLNDPSSAELKTRSQRSVLSCPVKKIITAPFYVTYYKDKSGDPKYSLEERVRFTHNLSKKQNHPIFFEEAHIYRGVVKTTSHDGSFKRFMENDNPIGRDLLKYNIKQWDKDIIDSLTQLPFHVRHTLGISAKHPYLRIGVIGSMQYTEKMLEIRDALKQIGHDAFVTNLATPFVGKTDEEKEIIKIYQKNNCDAIREFYDMMPGSDAVLVMNLNKNGIKNYIGGNTFLEMGFAHILNQKIFLYGPPPDIALYRSEIDAMRPVVINGDLSLIK